MGIIDPLLDLQSRKKRKLNRQDRRNKKRVDIGGFSYIEDIVHAARSGGGFQDRTLGVQQSVTGLFVKVAPRLGHLYRLMIALEEAQFDQSLQFHDSFAQG